VVSLVALRVRFPVCSGGTKVRRLVVSMIHMKQSPWDATDTFSWHRGATRTFPCIRFSISVSGRLVCMSYFRSVVRSCVLELRLRYYLIVHPLGER